MKKTNDLKKSLDKVKNDLEQARLNLKTASEEGIDSEVKYWSKQVHLIEMILRRLQGVGPKKS